MNKVCSRKDCEDLARHYLKETASYCPKHYRFKEMKHNSKRYKKDVPTWDECEILLFVWCLSFKCPVCNVQLKWNKGNGGIKNVVSIQHNNNGTIMFICHSCNSGHGSSKLGDEYLTIPLNKKYCPRCNLILDKNNFGKNLNKRNKLRVYCRECRAVQHQERKNASNNTKR